MVWEKNVYAIVMLTKCVEQGRVCNFYFLLLFRPVHSFIVIVVEGILKPILKKDIPPSISTSILRNVLFVFFSSKSF